MSQYKWALGHDVALAALTDVTNDLTPRNYRSVGEARHQVAVASTVVDPFPIHDLPLSAKDRGDGALTTTWTLILTAPAYSYLLTTYFGGRVGSVGVAMTIYTYLHETDAWGRFNCYASRPSASADNLVYLRSKTLRVVIPFNDLVEL